MTDIVNQIIHDAMRMVNHELEQQIKERLEIIGYVFNDRRDLIDFVIRRLTLVQLNAIDRELYIDYQTPNQKLLATWKHKYETNFEYDINNGHTFKVTYNP